MTATPRGQRPSLAACFSARWLHLLVSQSGILSSLGDTWWGRDPCTTMLHGILAAITQPYGFALIKAFGLQAAACHCQCCVLCFVQAMMEAGKLIVEHLVIQGLVAAFALPMTLLGASDIIDTQ